MAHAALCYNDGVLLERRLPFFASRMDLACVKVRPSERRNTKVVDKQIAERTYSRHGKSSLQPIAHTKAQHRGDRQQN